MDDLLAEINRKRESLDKCDITAKKKFYKRGDILANERAQALKEQEKKEIEKQSQLQEVRLQNIENQRFNKEKETKNKILPREEINRRLRSRNLPIRLFGESDADSCQRLWLSEVVDMEENKSLTNEFQDTLDKINKEVLMEHYNIDGNKNMKDFLVMDSDVTIESIKDNAKLLGKTDDMTKDCDIILSFLKLILSIWARDLNKRPKDIKVTLEGKMESARYEQTCSYIKPLLRKLKDRNLVTDIQKFLTLIVHFCLEREYVKANDAYLQMAIGNAPWPIGVTMVGIHPRTSRERISAHHVAHVLNDETQRKYIQAVKRIMTYCQRTYPSDPSRSVEHGAIDVNPE